MNNNCDVDVADDYDDDHDHDENTIIGHFGVAQGTGAGFKFKLIDKLTPSYKRSCWDWVFDQVWCSKVEKG